MSSPIALRQERTALIGMVIFLASWSMLFAALFCAYGAIRLRTPAWPPPDLQHLPLGLPACATAVLALSSAALARALAAARGRRDPRGLIQAAAGLGATFLVLQVVVWRDLWARGLLPGTGTYASVFYGLTVFHALHVVVGVLALGWLGLRRPTSPMPLRLWSLYWHMVAVVWGLIFVLVYLA